jgi:hypothetical protein
MKKSLLGLLPLVMLAACGGPGKKVIVMVKGTVTLSGNNITVKDGTGYSELEIPLKGGERNTLHAKSSNGTIDVDLPAEPGLFLLSLRADTVVGAYQPTGAADAGSGKVMSQEELKGKIDSLQQLTAGANVSAAKRNFLVAPNQLVKVTANPGARIYGPFRKVPDIIEPSTDGKEIEIYKFSTNNEVRDMIGKLTKMTH